MNKRCLNLWHKTSCAIMLLMPLLALAQPAKQKLVELTMLDSSIHSDVRYATHNNFLGRAVYPEARAFLLQKPAMAFVRVHRKLKQFGVGLLIFDGYRPWSVTKEFWESVPPQHKKFVANPKQGSVHNRGYAVDCSLYDVKTGKEISMPSAYDVFDSTASLSYMGGTAEQTKNRALLQTIMRSEGFQGVKHEWWHFDYTGWREQPVLNIPFSELYRR